jgi:hypothetical protein
MNSNFLHVVAILNNFRNGYYKVQPFATENPAFEDYYKVQPLGSDHV